MLDRIFCPQLPQGSSCSWIWERFFFCQDRICCFWGSPSYFYFFFLNFSSLFLHTKIYLYYSGKKIVSQMLCLYLVFVFPWFFNFDLESQREVGVWGAPGSGVCPGHCSIGGHVVALGWVRLYCKRKHRELIHIGNLMSVLVC